MCDFKNADLIKIGLTGGIGSGKSLVANLLKEEGFEVFNMDETGKKLLSSNRLKQKIKKLCPSVLKRGKIDRISLRKAIFLNKTLKKKIEDLLHPLIRKEFDKFCSRISKTKKMVICEAALMIETNYYKNFHKLITVIAKKEIRKKRVKKRDKINDDLVERIMNQQTTDSERLKKADYIIYNNGTISELKKKVHNLTKKLHVLFSYQMQARV